MSLVPDDVFDDAQVLCATYRQLIALIEADRSGGERCSKPQLKRARRALLQLDERLLAELIPEVFQCVLSLRMPYSLADWWKEPVCSRILMLAAQSLPNAKRLAHLFLQVLLYNYSGCSSEEMDWYNDILLSCIVDSSTVGHVSGRARFGFLARLVEASAKGDVEANSQLRLFDRLLYRWRFALYPIAQESETEDHRQQLLESLEIAHTTLREEGAPPLVLPLGFASPYFEALQRARNDELALFSDAAYMGPLDAFWDQITLVPLAAYDAFLEATWQHICEQSAPNLVLAGGRDKVAIRHPYYNHNGLVSLAFVRERPHGGFYSYPEIGIQLFFQDLCERSVREIQLDSEGRIKGFEETSWPPQLSAMLWCVIVNAYAQIVVSSSEAEGRWKPFRVRHGVRKGRRAASEKVVVRPHFRKLPSGWEASQQQVEEAIAATGKPPQPGYTFVGECHRGFPGTVLPSQTASDLWEEHEKVRPSLVVDSGSVGMLLEHIPHFV